MNAEQAAEFLRIRAVGIGKLKALGLDQDVAEDLVDQTASVAFEMLGKE